MDSETVRPGNRTEQNSRWHRPSPQSRACSRQNATATPL